MLIAPGGATDAAAACPPKPHITSTVTVQLAVAFPYRPVADLSTDTEDSGADCSFTDREILLGAQLDDVQGCGGVEIHVSFTGWKIPPGALYNGSAHARVTTHYGCVRTSDGEVRDTVTDSHIQLLSAGAADPVIGDDGSGVFQFYDVWAAPILKVSCRTGEQPAELSITVHQMRVDVGADFEKPVLSFPVTGSWTLHR
ncbi:hypothetical protein [Nakamurella endophytica]|uniref:DUF4360 domain-containing protein n=1 Tax=Nakamurella endophytica TaxID=1748367 RepID=A0A917TDP3_9ACTN|nr:hypothetical protein [Nakamurella endophytica]GGM19036.1 hypothetical protein GCM10011594_43910 [Nakamurella endophytica]